MRWWLGGCVLVCVACGDDGSADGGPATDGSTAAVTSGSGDTMSACLTAPCPTMTSPGTTTTATSGTETTGDPATTDGSSSSGEPEPGALRLYVTGGAGISVWEIDNATGNLTAIEVEEVQAGLSAMAIDPALGFVYAAHTGSQSIVALSVDAQTGELDEVATTNVGHRSAYVAVDGTGGYLLSVDFGGNLLEVYPIEGNGAVGAVATASVGTSVQPHATVLDETNAFLFVPCRDGDVVEQYLFDDTTGTVVANDPATATVPAGTGPRHMVISPDGTQAFLGGENGSTLVVFDYDAAGGQLSYVESLSTLPKGFKDDNSVADVHITPDGAFVYVSNRGHDSLAMFEVDAGAVTALGQTSTEPIPREFALSPRGRYVYSAGQGSGRMSSYVVMPTGTLLQGPAYDVGADPGWVLAVEQPLE